MGGNLVSKAEHIVLLSGNGLEMCIRDSTTTYENVQARERTQILMDLANKNGGLVVGTVDLSEIALCWSTYNGDHMSMYAVNCSIPKTLIRCLIEHIAGESSPELAATLSLIHIFTSF